MLFFSELISNLNKSFGRLLGIKTEEDDEEGKESGEQEEDSGNTKTNRFSDKWGWINLVDEVSKTVGTEWKNVFTMEIREFLNIASYMKDKNRELERLHKEMMSKIKK